MVPEEFLCELLSTPSPSGYEQPVQKIVRTYAEQFTTDLRTDWHGNLIAAVNPDSAIRIMLDAHCDQIGLLIKYVDDSGFLRVSPIGGWDVQTLLGQTMQVWTDSGPVTGVIARKAIHLLSPEERKSVPEVKDLWVDIGVRSRDEALELVKIGDPVTLELGFHELRNGLLAGPGMDDRVGVWVVFEALRRIAEARPQVAVFAVSSVQEEIGLRGAKTSAFSVDPHLGIAVDVTHATDCPTIKESEHGQIKMGAGPVVVRGPNANPTMFRRLQQISHDRELPIQTNAISRPASNDGNAIQISRGGVATAIVAIPNRYMHSPVEVVSKNDIENAAELIAHFCLSVSDSCDFTP